MKLKRYFERIFAINLPCKEDRRERLAGHLEELGLADPGDIAWVRAVSGEMCPPPPYFQAGGGAWGCLQSHLRLAQDAAMDGLESYLVLEDDAVFDSKAPSLLEGFMAEVPADWGQLYLGGQHLHEPEPVEGASLVYRCHNVNRTHAYALHRRAFGSFQRHVSHAPDYIARDSWHLDHQLGIAHGRRDWATYAPVWWLAGQEEGASDISGRENPRLWWHLSRFSGGLPFIHVSQDCPADRVAEVRKVVHFGNHRKEGTLEDIGLDRCVNDDHELGVWLEMIAREAIDRGMLPGLSHPSISRDRVASLWTAGAFAAEAADLSSLLDYPYNGLFPHPLNKVAPSLFCVARAG